MSLDYWCSRDLFFPHPVLLGGCVLGLKGLMSGCLFVFCFRSGLGSRKSWAGIFTGLVWHGGIRHGEEKELGLVLWKYGYVPEGNVSNTSSVFCSTVRPSLQL